MVRLLAICLFTFLASNVLGQTNFSGFVNSTVRLTKAQSPVTFGSVIIQGGTLIIDPGVEMIAATANSYISLHVGSLSRLSVQGTELEPVVFRPAGDFTWRGIYNISRSTRPKIEITNAMIFGLGRVSRSLDFPSADLLFVNSIFQGSGTSSSGTPTIGIANSKSIGLIEGCLIDGFNTGILAGRGLTVRDTEVRNAVTPVAMPQNVNVIVSLAIE